MAVAASMRPVQRLRSAVAASVRPVQRQWLNVAAAARMDGGAQQSRMDKLMADFKVNTTREGTGRTAQLGDMVTANYTGIFLDGTKFDSSMDRAQPFKFQLGVGAVIRAWDLAFSQVIRSCPAV